MSEQQWVCHISGQGEKWEVLTNHVAAWQVMSPLSGATFMFPKSEYRLCDPPEVWRDVTEECAEGITSFVSPTDLVPVVVHKKSHLGPNYRLRKVELHPLNTLVGKQWAFIVEQKVPR